MKLQKLLFSTMFTFGLAATAYAGPIGMAESLGNFEIQRGDESLVLPQNKEVIVNSGDVLTATDDPVLFYTNKKSNLFLNSDTQIVLKSDEQLSLVSGQMALGFTAEAPMIVSYEDLQIIPQALADTTTVKIKPAANIQEGSSILVDAVSANEVFLRGIGDSFVIRNLDQTIQHAVIAPGDVMRLIKDADGNWASAPIPDFTANLNSNNLQRSVETNDDRRFGAFWWDAAALGLIGAGAAGLYIYETVDDNEDDSRRHHRNKRDREETSPVIF